MTLRIGLDISPAIGQLGGIPRYILELAKQLSLDGEVDCRYFDGTSWHPQLPALGPGERPNPNSRLLGLGRKLAVGPLRPLARKVWKGVFHHGLERGASRLDLIHYPNYFGPAVSAPEVLTVHDLGFLRFPETLPSDRLRWLQEGLEPALERAARVLVPSHFTASELVALTGIPVERVSVVPMGVGERFLEPLGPERRAEVLARLELPVPYLLAVGTLEPRKNLSTLIRDHAELPAALRSRYPLVLAGARGWKDQALMEQITARSASGELRVLQQVTDDELAALYQSARLVCYPSLYEGFGIPPLEAMASRVPVLVSRASSLPEICGPYVRYADPLDSAAWTAALQEELETEPDPRRLQAAFERARSFNWKRTERDSLRAYQQALGRW